MLTVPDSIKDLLHLDSCQKNIRIHFPNGERSDICNNLIVRNTVSLTESLCSQNTLKFGLCEAPVFECEVVGVGNIKGATIEVFCEIYCDATATDAVFQPDLQHYVYQIPYGVFVIQSAKRQADMNHRKITAYGGSAASDWKFSESESKKICYVSGTNPCYTPNAGFFLAANSYFTLDDIVDEESFAPSNLMVDRGYSGVVSFTLYYYQVEWAQTAGDGKRDDWQYLFRVDHSHYDADYKKKIADFVHQYYNYNFSRTDVPLFHNSIRHTISDSYFIRINYDCDNEYFYPYANGYYASNRGLRWMILGRISVGIRRNGELIDSRVFDLYSEKPNIYKITYKSAYSYMSDIGLSIPLNSVYHDEVTPEMTTQEPNLSEFDLQTYINNYLEIRGCFGRFSRTDPDKMELLNIKRQFGLTPSSSQYPGASVYPQGVTGGKLLPGDYQTCWYDDNYTTPIGAIKFTYVSSGQVIEGIYYLTGYNEDSNPDSYRVYDLTANGIVKGTMTLATMNYICQMIKNNIENVSYMPVDFVGRGLPYVEEGDTFEILTASNDSITTIVLNRTLSGEQVLTDSYKSV